MTKRDFQHLQYAAKVLNEEAKKWGSPCKEYAFQCPVCNIDILAKQFDSLINFYMQDPADLDWSKAKRVKLPKLKRTKKYEKETDKRK